MCENRGVRGVLAHVFTKCVRAWALCVSAECVRVHGKRVCVCMTRFAWAWPMCVSSGHCVCVHNVCVRSEYVCTCGHGVCMRVDWVYDKCVCVAVMRAAIVRVCV